VSCLDRLRYPFVSCIFNVWVAFTDVNERPYDHNRSGYLIVQLSAGRQSRWETGNTLRNFCDAEIRVRHTYLGVDGDTQLIRLRLHPFCVALAGPTT